MSSNSSPRLARRGFLARLSAAAASFTVLAGAPTRMRSALAPITSPEADPDAWIDRLRGTDRLIFHAHERFQPAMLAARGVLTEGKATYGLAESDNSVVVATHGPAAGALLQNELWDKYALGEVYKLADPRTGTPTRRNLYLEPQDGAPADATVPGLIDRGVVFLVCNVALRNLSKRLAQDLEAEAIHRELVARVVPGAIVVPNVYIAMSRAQKKGVSYVFVG
jgi:hypothetical protein